MFGRALAFNVGRVGDLRARGLMLLGAGFSAAIPALLALGGGIEAAFLFNAWVGLGAIASYAAFLIFVGSRGFFSRGFWREALRRAPGVALALGTATNFNYALVGLAASLAGIAAAAAIYESWLLFALAGGAILSWRRERVEWAMFGILGVGLIGGALALAARVGDFGVDGAAAGALALECGLALGAAAIGGIGVAYEIRWGVDFSRDVGMPRYGASELCCVAVMYAFGNAVALPVKAAVGIARGEILGIDGAVYGLAAGACVAGAALCWRAANARSASGGVNALWQVAPVGAIGLLLALGLADVARADYLIAGGAIIATANVAAGIIARKAPK